MTPQDGPQGGRWGDAFVAWLGVVLLVVLLSVSAVLGWKLMTKDDAPPVAMSTAAPTVAPVTEEPPAVKETYYCATGISAGGTATLDERTASAEAAATMAAEVGSCPLLRGTDGSKMRAGWSPSREAVVFRNEKGFSYYDADTPEIFKAVVGRMIAGSA